MSRPEFPVEIEYVDRPRCAVIRPTGPWTPEAALSWVDAVAVDPRFTADLPLLYDLDQLSTIGRSPADLRRFTAMLMQHYPELTGPVAMVATADLGFGMARMFEAIVDGELPRSRKVFRSLDAAFAWLEEIA